MLETITSDGRVFRICWQHVRRSEDFVTADGQRKKKIVGNGGSTRCDFFLVTKPEEAMKEDQETLVATARAFCHEKDNFSKGRGRKLSLRRALYKAFPDRAERKPISQAVFETYLQKFPEKRPG